MDTPTKESNSHSAVQSEEKCVNEDLPEGKAAVNEEADSSPKDVNLPAEETSKTMDSVEMEVTTEQVPPERSEVKQNEDKASETGSSTKDKTDLPVEETTKTMDLVEMEVPIEQLEENQNEAVVETEGAQITSTSQHTDVEMGTTISTDPQIIKQEPTDMEEELAQDFTRRADFPTKPTIKQEKNVSLNEEIAKEQAAESKAVLQIANSSLSLLTQYISSESDSNISDSDEELARKNPNPVRHDSTSSTSSSSDDDVAEVIPNTASYRSQQTAIVISDTETAPNGSDDDDDESGDEEARPKGPIKARGELLVEELPPIEELHITVREEDCKSVGFVESIVAQIVLVQSYSGVELLNLDTVLFLEKGKRPLGKIFDVIGQVAAPIYCVLFNSRQDVADKGITVGTPVYCAPQTEHTSFIILSDLMRHKGSDASWLDDIEVPDHALEYSDDEQERRARRRRGSCSSSGRHTPEGGDQRRPYPYRRGRGRGFHRGGGQRNYHSWHHNFPSGDPSQRVINPFAVAAAASQAPPPPPPPSSG